ncbi:hypothetical protein C2E23DRAFT_687602, partial [Lenzites betulinus]
MRIDGTTIPNSHVDEESGSVVLRRLHPRIASYNPVTIFLIQSNMEIKFIGSGEAAKALMYYITDYITKESLPTHVGLGALSYAIQRTNEKFPDATAIDVRSAGTLSRGALNVTVNRMMSRQELSHQQVMSYLVGGGDVYTSHTFKVLHWGAFDRLFKRTFEPQHMPQERSMSDDVVAGEQATEDEDSFSLKLDSTGTISATNQCQDYMYRGTDAEFTNLCLYEFVGRVDKETMSRGARRRGGGMTSNEVDQEVREIADVQNVPRGRGRAVRGTFASPEHTQFETHILRLRKVWSVPVILGDRVPRSDRGEEEKEAWARMMLIMFVAWRQPTDLKDVDESWVVAFERQRSRITAEHMRFIANMNVLSECRDVRDSFRDMRRAEALALITAGLPADVNRPSDALDEAANQEFELFEQPGAYDAYGNVNEHDSAHGVLDNKIGIQSRELLDYCCGVGPASAAGVNEPEFPVDVLSRSTVQDDGVLRIHASTMQKLKRDRRPTSGVDMEDGERPRKRHRVAEMDANVTRGVLEGMRRQSAAGSEDANAQAINDVVQEMQLHGNPEQERAFRIIAEHIVRGEDQLLMYIAGVGGTGKTHIVKAVRRFFQLLGR